MEIYTIMIRIESLTGIRSMEAVCNAHFFVLHAADPLYRKLKCYLLTTAVVIFLIEL